MQAILMPKEIGGKAVYLDAPNWQGTVGDLIEALKKGVTEWINTRPEGQRELARKGTFTLADLAGYTPDCFMRSENTLAACLNQAGIILVTIKLVDTDIDTAILDVDADTNLYEGEGVSDE